MRHLQNGYTLLLQSRSSQPSASKIILLLSGIWMDQFWSTSLKRLRLWIVPVTAQCWRMSWSQQYITATEDFYLKAFFSFMITYVLKWPLQLLTSFKDGEFRSYSILPPYSPDLDLWLSCVLNLKDALRGWKFGSDNEMKEVVCSSLRADMKIFFSDGIRKLVNWCEKFIEKEGD